MSKARSTQKWFRHGTFSKCSPLRQLTVSRRRWESNPLDAALQAAATPCDFSVNYSVPLPGIEPNLRPSQSRVHPPHFKDNILFLSHRANDVRCQIIHDRASRIPHRGIEPRPTASKAVMHPPHPQGIFIRDKQGRRLDSHQHDSAYKADAFLDRATSAVSTSVRI